MREASEGATLRSTGWWLLRAAEWRLRDRLSARGFDRVVGLGRRVRVAGSRWISARLFAVSHEGVIPGLVHLGDWMIGAGTPAAAAHYARVGREGVELIERALDQAGTRLDDVDSVLDFPSGYGRVTRQLAGRISARRITAADVEEEAVRFCQAEFSVHGRVTAPDLGQLGFGRQFQVIFVGSLLTHLDAQNSVLLLRALVAALQDDGVLIFTTHGESCLDHLYAYGDDIRQAEEYFRYEVTRHGFAFRPYSTGPRDYGLSIHAKAYVEATIAGDPVLASALRLLYFARRGWDDHHDVWAFQKRSREAHSG